MECPKCGCKIDDNTLVCPNCKKVLKLICPVCNSINTTNTCKNCGYIIISKCHNCGKINPTIIGKCPRCGFDTNVSAILHDSNIDEFACLTFDFPNIQDLKSVFGSKELYDKFRDKLNSMIYDFAKSIGLKRGVFADTYVIRFNKDYTYAASAKNAVKSTIELLNRITKINGKLLKEKNFILKCNAAIIKRSAYSSAEDYKSGVNINMLYTSDKSEKLINNLQLITDGSVYETVKNTYPMEAIGMSVVKGKNLFLYELDLTKFVKTDFKEEQQNTAKDGSSELIIPESIKDDDEILEEEDSIYDIDGFTFDEIRCTFEKDISQGLSGKIVQNYMGYPKGISVIKGKKEHMPRTMEFIGKITQAGIFQKVYAITCYDYMKFKPYGFLNELISSIFNFSLQGRQDNFSKISELDEQQFLQDVINFKEREFPHPEDVRAGLFDIFTKIAQAMKNTLIIIEDADKIDDTSFEFLQLLFKNFENYDISWLIFANKDYSLHKSAHFLLSKPYYTEITIKPTPIKTLIEANATLCKNILDTFYMKKISKNAKGSQMYFMQALLHLMDLGIFEVKKGSLELMKQETVLFPTTLTELLQRRLNYIKNIDDNMFNLYICLLIMGPQTDINTIAMFGHPNTADYLGYLEGKGYITSLNGTVLLQNYNMYTECANNMLSPQDKAVFANFVLNKFYGGNTAHPIMAKLYKIIGNEKNEFVQWENLSNINRSLGDFSAYLNCSMKLLKLLSNNVNEATDKSIEDYKLEVYENISNLLYKYTPEKISNITQVILDNLENGMNDKKVINLCNKIMQGCLIAGNYSQALIMAHKILSHLEFAGINPHANDFNVQAFLISLVKIEILFNVGNLEDCIDSGDEIFGNLVGTDIQALIPKTVSPAQFYDLLKDAAGYVIFAKILQLKNDTYKFCELAEQIVPNLPDTFKLFVELNNLIHGKEVNLPPLNENTDKFGFVLYFIISAFKDDLNNPDKFAAEIYRAKLKAMEYNLSQIELFCDLMIGRAYMKKAQTKKANSIFSSVLETSQNNGLKNLFYLAAYHTAELALINNDIATAYGIISNTIVELEKNRNKNLYILMMFKIIYARVLGKRNETNQADFCYNQAKQIAQNCNLKLNI